MFFLRHSKKALVSLVITAALVGCSGPKSESDHLILAKTSIEKGEVKTAIISLKNILKINSENTEGRFLLGQVYLNRGLWVSAEKELELALMYGYSKTLVIPLLSKAYYHLGDVKGLEELLLNSSSLSDEAQIALKTFIAITFIKEEYHEQGLNYLHEVVEMEYDSKYKELSKAWKFGVNKEIPKALSVINNLLAAEPQFMEAIEYKAYLHFKEQDMVTSAEYFGKYIEVHPQAHELRMMYALALVYSEQYIEAEKHVDLLLTAIPGNSKLNEIKAQIRFAENDYTKSKQYADIASRNNLNMIMSRVISGISSYQLKQFEVAYSTLNSVKSHLSYQHPARKLLNKLKLQLGYENDLFDELSTAQADILDLETLTVSANELFKIGKEEEADSLLSIALNREPNNAEVLYQQGLLKVYNNDPSAYIFFEKAIENNPELESAMSMLLLESLKKNDFVKAFSIADKAAIQSPELGFTYQGIIFVRKGELAKAKLAFNQALKINKLNAGVSFKLGQIHEIENDIDSAISLYQNALTSNLNFPLAASSLLELSLNIDNRNKIESIFEDLIKNNKLEHVVYVYSAYFYIEHMDLSKAEEALNLGLKAIPDNLDLLMLKGRVQANTKNYDSALESFNRLLSLSPDNGMYHIAKATVLKSSGKIKEAIDSQKIALKLMPRSTEAALGLVDLYFKGADLAEASSILNNMSYLPKFNLIVDGFKGKAAFLNRDYINAVPLLRRVFDKIKSDEVTLQLSTSLQQMQKTTDAIAVIEEYQTEKRGKVDLFILLKYAELLEPEKPQKALSVYEDIIDKSERHFVILNNMAMLYLKQGEFNKAAAIAQESYAKSNSNIAVMNTYGLTLLATNDLENGMIYLKKTFLSDQNNENYKLHYAQALFLSNKIEQSKALWGSVRKSALNGYTLIMYDELSKSF